MIFSETLSNGITAKHDPSIGLLVFSPYTGVIYAIHESESENVLSWLNGRSESPRRIYEQTIGPGISIPIDDAQHVVPHLLPSRESWRSLPAPSNPIVINWLITGRCPLACKYCWAEDLMRNDAQEPEKEDIYLIADRILQQHPLVVVITGGDPLFSPHLSLVLSQLSGKVGIVIDTSGYTLSDHHIELFKKHNVVMRISLDSERERVNEYQRPLYPKYPAYTKSGIGTTEAALRAIVRCIESGISVAVQTVATVRNANDLVAMGDKLFRLGIRSWRVGKVAPSEASMDGYIELIGKNSDEKKGPYSHVFNALREAQTRNWQSKMSVQVMHNGHPNAVILVGPNGIFYTESNLKPGKVVIDKLNPKNPSQTSIITNVNMVAHGERYLNLTRP